MAELLGSDVPIPLETKYAAIWRHNKIGPCKACDESWIERVTVSKMKLARSIRDDGFRENDRPPITVGERDGRLIFLEGTHRACCLLVLGLPVIVDLQDPLPEFDPLERYPLKE